MNNDAAFSGEARDRPGESCVSRLEQRLERFQGFGKRILLQFTDESISFLSQARDRACIIEEVVLDARQAPCLQPVGGEVDCSVRLGRSDFERLYADELQPRFALFIEAMSISGDPAIAVKFADRLQGRSFVNTDVGLSRTPQLTADVEIARADLKDAGYCLIGDALTAEQVRLLRERLDDQAAGESAKGVAIRDGGVNTPNQRVWSLVNKGRVFLDLLEFPLIHGFGREYLGENYQIFSYSANIAGPGGSPQPLHYDQVFAQPDLPLQLGMNFVFFLDDVTDANGGTRLIPGSHKPDVAPDNPLSISETIAAEGPAGTMMIFDSRLWHGTGPNVTQERRRVLLLFLTRYFIRPQENALLFLDPDVEESLTDQAKALLGFRCSNGVGGGGHGPRDGLIPRDSDPVIATSRDGVTIPYAAQQSLKFR